MSMAGLQGELCALREEVEAGQLQVEALKQEVVTSTAAHAYLLAQYEEQASLIVKMEEIKSLSEEKQAKLEEEVKESKSHLEASRELREDLEGRIDKCRISPGSAQSENRLRALLSACHSSCYLAPLRIYSGWFIKFHENL